MLEDSIDFDRLKALVNIVGLRFIQGGGSIFPHPFGLRFAASFSTHFPPAVIWCGSCRSNGDKVLRPRCGVMKSLREGFPRTKQRRHQRQARGEVLACLASDAHSVSLEYERRFTEFYSLVKHGVERYCREVRK